MVNSWHNHHHQVSSSTSRGFNRKKTIILPTGECSDMINRDLNLNIPGAAPTILYPCFIDSWRVSCLSIPDSQIEHISVGAFDAMPNLLYLDLSRNRIEFCDLLTFGGHDKLKTLVYDENNNSYGKYTNLILEKSGYFPKLNHLYLRNNYLRDIKVSIAKYMPSLTHLYLSDNKLSGETFDNIELPNCLSHLHLERNLINKFGCNTDYYNRCQLNNNNNEINLVSLFLDGNNIKTLCSNYCNINSNNNNQLNLHAMMKRLEFLSLSHNAIGIIDRDTFEDAPYLKSINIAHNEIRYISPGTLDRLDNLRDLSLSYNKLTTISQIFNNVKYLTSLSLDHNEISHIERESFKQLPYLKWLTIGANKINFIDTNAFINLPILEELDLSDNELSYLPNNWIINVPALRKLDISNNFFTNIESINIDNHLLTSLQLLQLYIQNNPLSSNILYWKNSHNAIILDNNNNNNNNNYIIPRYCNEWRYV
ncbi:leucine-rich repeat-containing protein 15-like [Aphidius gifuensis]|uniref:leucine-rich repeat-containing protein 15-like n=1 Tax=Aphidius gifuensis TaxID=684658 RepID=UPI001CDC5819|nr:leucine-rich repeat-containing protein 15-like [Aphidius gifuensis]